MLVLFRVRYVIIAFVIGGFCGMWAAFSAKGCGERIMTNVPPIHAPARVIPAPDVHVTCGVIDNHEPGCAPMVPEWPQR
jgi:hypothetical protein